MCVHLRVPIQVHTYTNNNKNNNNYNPLLEKPKHLIVRIVCLVSILCLQYGDYHFKTNCSCYVCRQGGVRVHSLSLVLPIHTSR